MMRKGGDMSNRTTGFEARLARNPEAFATCIAIAAGEARPNLEH
jgi:hypothetical protein